MKHIKTFPLFESVSLTPDQKHLLDSAIWNNLKQSWVQDPTTGKVTTLGSFNGYSGHAGGDDTAKNRRTFQSIVFDVAEGDFMVRRMDLETMKGFPSVIEGSLIANDNFFFTLEGMPKLIYKDAELQDNWLIALEGMEETEIKGQTWLGQNLVRPAFLLDDLENAGRIKTWMPIYLDILSGDTGFSPSATPKKKERAIEFILEEKTTKANLEEGIRVAPAEMKESLSRRKAMPQELQDLLPTLDVPADFWGHTDLMTDLGDVGL
jgi:hypothetical protein